MNHPKHWHILIIDDNPDDRAEFRRMLIAGSGRTCRFMEAELGRTGLQMILDNQIQSLSGTVAPFDCVLLDFNLPDINATQLLTTLCAGSGRTLCPVVVMTGWDGVDASDGPKLLQAGAQDYIGKSWTTAPSLCRAIENSIDRFKLSKTHDHARQALTSTQDRYRTLVNAIDQGYCVIEMIFDAQDQPVNYRFLEVSQSFERQTGLTNAVGKTILQLIPSLELKWLQAYGKVALTGESIRIEDYVEQMNRWFDLYAFRLGDPAKRQLGILFNNVTERKLTEQALHHSEALSRATLNALPAQIVVLDAQGWVISANQSWADFAANHCAGEFTNVSLGTNYIEACRQASAAGVAEATQALAGVEGVLKGHVAQFSFEYAGHNPSAQRWYLYTVAPLDVGGNSGVVISQLDITIRKVAEMETLQAKAAADQANQAKSRFLAAASHDLRQPLAALLLYVNVLKDRLPPSEQGLQIKIKDCVRSLSDLLNDLLDLSKLEAGVVSPGVSDFAIAQVLATLQSLHTPEAQFKGLQLRCLTSPLTARTDPVLYKRILSNLIDNAICHTERGGVLIACRRSQGKHWIEVWDTGVGIPADKTEEIFEEFRQLGDGARNKGSGLGLAIVAKASALLGLEIRVRSRVNRGSVFAIELPLGEADFLPVPQALPGEISRPLRIALVEDNRVVRDAMVAALQSRGHQVVAAATAAELLTELSDQPPAIVVSDFRLAAGETGYDAIASVRARYGAELPALLITGDTDPLLLSSMTDRGIAVLHKPVDLETLQAVLEDLADQGD
jgi:signal transduction histidine kinase/DNA-binding response OmpR family regulator